MNGSGASSIKSMTEILGGAHLLLGVSFDLQDAFEEYLSEEQRAFLVLLRLIEEDSLIRTLRSESSEMVSKHALEGVDSSLDIAGLA